MAKNSRETWFLHRRNGRTDRPSYRDAFLTDASKNFKTCVEKISRYGPSDRRMDGWMMDGWTDTHSYRDARTHLKMIRGGW